MKTKFFLLTLLFSVSCMIGNAQESANEKENQFSVDVQVRPRAEYRNGYKYPLLSAEMAAGFVSNRSRLSVNYERSGLSVGLSLQNVSVWGAQQLANANPNTTMNEAWAQLKSKEGLYAKFGRQNLTYDDGRLLSVADWNQNGRFHDALKLGYKTKVHTLDAIIAYNQDGERDKGGTYYSATGMPYKMMEVLYYQYNGAQQFTPSFIFINVGLENGVAATRETKMVNMQTIGTNLIYKPVKDFTLKGAAYYQFGKSKTAAAISACMLVLRADYNVVKDVSIYGGSDYLSGESNNPDNNTAYNAFNTLYAGNHGLYGTMDYFYDSPFLSNLNPGLWDNYVGISVKPISKLTLGAAYHYFSMATDIYRGDARLKKLLGSELDIQVDYNVMKDVKMTCGYAAYFGTVTMNYIKGGDNKAWQDWAFFTISVSPRVFSAKW